MRWRARARTTGMGAPTLGPKGTVEAGSHDVEVLVRGVGVP